MQEIFSLVLSFVLIIIFLWFTYSIANIIVTFFRCRKQDHSLQLCLNTGGLIFYVILRCKSVKASSRHGTGELRRTLRLNLKKLI